MPSFPAISYGLIWSPAQVTLCCHVANALAIFPQRSQPGSGAVGFCRAQRYQPCTALAWPCLLPGTSHPSPCRALLPRSELGTMNRPLEKPNEDAQVVCTRETLRAMQEDELPTLGTPPGSLPKRAHPNRSNRKATHAQSAFHARSSKLTVSVR